VHAGSVAIGDHDGMSRRLAALTLVVLILLGCGGTPAVPEITDPKEILTKALTAMSQVKTVHVEGEVTGALNLDLLGRGEASEVRLTGTSGEADVDVAGSKLRATFTVLGFIDGEVIQLGQTSYVRTSQTGPTFQRSTTDLLGGLNPLDALAGPQGLLNRPELTPVKIADASCGEANQACYQVELELTAADIAGLASLPADLLGGIDIGSIRVVVGVEKDTLRIGRLVVGVSAGATGTLELALNLSSWDVPVTIEAPPGDQIE
jgi:hypothetical protein